MDKYISLEMQAAARGMELAGEVKAFLERTKGHRDTALGEFVKWLDLEERRLLRDELDRWAT